MNELMQVNSVENEIYEMIKEYSTKSEIELSGSLLVSELGIDSIDVMEIIFHLEEKYGVEIDELELVNVSKLDDLVALAVSSAQTNRAPSA